MQGRRRFWASASVGGVLALLAILYEQPFLLVGAAGVAAWLIGRQYAFVRSLGAAYDDLRVDEASSRERVYTEESVPVTLTGRLEESTPLALSLESRPPVTLTGSTRRERTARFSAGETEATATFSVDCPVAGEHEFEPPLVRAGDRDGLYGERFSYGYGVRVTVEPRAPRRIHVGEGGTPVAAAYGEHDSDGRGSGLDPAELRQYTTSDAAHHIDWKATARLGEPYIREYETQTDRQTVLIIDHRAATGAGPAGETKLDYLRQVALAVVRTAARLNDPVGLYAVGDAGITDQHPRRADQDHYRRLRERLRALTPTNEGDQRATSTDPATARRATAALRTDESAFAATLSPFLGATDQYVARVASNPLVGAVRTYRGRVRGSAWTVLYTDDSDPVGVLEAVKIARRREGHVLVFLAPSVLFDADTLSDFDAAYDRYLEFESFRRDLSLLDGVTALEVGPADRVEALLATRRPRQRGSAPR